MRLQRVMQKGFEKTAAVAIYGSKTGLHLLAERHELIHFGNDATLLGKGLDSGRVSS